MVPRRRNLGKIAVELQRAVANRAVDVLRPSGRPGRPFEMRHSRIVRTIERHPDCELTLEKFVRNCGLSPYHFLRTFERVGGLTPHRYILRTRLREAAVRLVAGPAKVSDVALDCGFGGVSNFNRAFRSEFGASPREYRRRGGR